MGETSANSPLSAATTVPSSIFPSPHRSSRITQHRLSDMKTAVPLDRSARRHASPPTQSLWTSSLALTKNPDVFSESVRHSTPNASFGRSPMLQQGLRPALDSPFGNPRSEIKQEQSHSGPTLLEDDSTAWVTVFGYPAAQASLILDQFSHFGTIEKYLITNNGNWMHLKYQNKIQAKCALNKNGRIFLGNIMIGVRRCTDMEVMRSSAAITLADGLSAKVPSDETKVTMRPPGADFRSPGFLDSPLREVGNKRDDLINHSFTGPTQKPGTPSAVDQRPTSGLTRHSSMRPLTGTYRPPCSALSRTSQNQSFRVPHGSSKGSGLLSKALDYVFGWN
nr:unnamed protein product [Spirometra erinaceieuropaei]